MARTIRSQVMDFVENNGPTRRIDIIAEIRRIQGRSFDPKRDRGYYSSSFSADTTSFYYHSYDMPNSAHPVKPGQFRRPTKNDPRYLVKTADGKYTIAR